MNPLSDARRRVNGLTVVLGIATVLACGGSGTEKVLPAFGWSLTPAAAEVSHGSPSTRTIKLKLESSGGEHFVRVTLKEPPPTGWTVSLPTDPIHLDPPAIQNVDVNAVVTIPAGVAPGTFRLLTFVGTQTNGPNAGTQLETPPVKVNVANGVTQVRIVGGIFSDSVREIPLEVTWAEASSWSTLMGIKDFDFELPDFAGPGEAVVWFTPKSGGISLDPGDVDMVTMKLLPTSNKVDRIFNVRPFFAHSSGEYGVNVSLNSTRGSKGVYEILGIDYGIGVYMADPDKTTNYTVEFTQVPPGRLSFSTINVPGRFTATVTPSFVDLNAGGTGSVRVDVTRIASGLNEDTEEFILRANHEDPAYNQTVKLPIQSWVGR
ncbi:MAG: hypothetical protein IT363_05090 [Methanoregulaceae archaeon]|nr:hypothetical protein [Methanoregulaceae archaeon]